MSEMKTRVAIALGERLKTAFDGKPATMHELAEIALKAMREPTEEMLDCPDFPYCPGEAKQYWQSMIDAALTAPSSTPTIPE